MEILTWQKHFHHSLLLRYRFSCGISPPRLDFVSISPRDTVRFGHPLIVEFGHLCGVAVPREFNFIIWNVQGSRASYIVLEFLDTLGICISQRDPIHVFTKLVLQSIEPLIPYG